MKNILVTGGAGFIGSAFVRIAARCGYQITVVDKLTYAGDRRRLASVRKLIRFYKADICRAEAIDRIMRHERPDAIIHFAAETHVDRSIRDIEPFVHTNIQGTAVLLNTAARYRIKKFIHISTDEIYGEIANGKFRETSPVQPKNPYSSTKAAADFLVLSAIRAQGFPAVIVRPCNNYGPWQYPEKLIPVAILKARADEKIPVYARGRNVREWLYVDDCAEAVLTVLRKGQIGAIYNVASGVERKNIDTVRLILKALHKPDDGYIFVKDRPGHDLRYASRCDALRRLGWRPRTGFEEGLAATVAWAEAHARWMEAKAARLKGYWKDVYKPQQRASKNRGGVV